MFQVWLRIFFLRSIWKEKIDHYRFELDWSLIREPDRLYRDGHRGRSEDLRWFNCPTIDHLALCLPSGGLASSTVRSADICRWFWCIEEYLSRGNVSSDRVNDNGTDLCLFQEKSIKWKNERNEMDGVTTNGILLMHLDGEQFDTNSNTTKWKEVSVGGSVFDLGEGRLKFNYQSAVNIDPCLPSTLFDFWLISFSLLRTPITSFAMELWLISAVLLYSGDRSMVSNEHR